MLPLLLGIAAVLVLIVGGAAFVYTSRDRHLRARLPELEKKMKAILGDGLVLEDASLGPSLELTLRGRLPIGGGPLRLDGAVVNVSGVPAFLRGRGDATQLRIEKIQGTLALDAVGTIATLRAPATYVAAAGARGDRWLDGALTIRGAAWTHYRTELGAPPPFDLDATLVLGPATWQVEGKGKLQDAALELATGGPLAREPRPTARLVVAGASGDALRHAAAAGGVPARVKLPDDVVATAKVELAADGARAVTLEAQRGARRIDAQFTLRADETLQDGTLRGRTDAGELVELGLVARDPTLPVGELELDARIEGNAARPVLAGKAFAKTLDVTPGAAGAVLRVEDAAAEIRVEQDRLAITSGTARFLEGRLTLGLSLQTGDGAQGEAHVAVQGIRIEQVPTGAGARALEDQLRGALTGNARIAWRPGDAKSLDGQGSLELAAPEYLFLAQSRAALSTVGLPALPHQGDGPCKATIALAPDKVELKDLDGRVRGLSFRGALATTWTGEATGRIDARLSEEFLQQSLLLVLPSVFTGSVTVPITVKGPLAKPEVKADLAGALGGFGRKSATAKIVTGVLDGLWNAVEGPSVPAGPELDPLLEQIIQGGAEGDRWLDKLIDTGISVGDVERLIADYKRRKRRR